MQPSESLLKELSDQKYALDQSSIVAATDRTGTITYVNQKFCEISGFTQSELLGQNHRIINSGYHDSGFFKNMWKTISAGQVWNGEVCNKKKSGEKYWVQTTVVPFLDETGTPYQYLSIRHDITALKLAQQTIVDQQLKLAASSRLSALGEVAACITHEINNPLGVILGRCEMMRLMLDHNDMNPIELKKIAEMIEITGRRIEKIVKNMRSFAHGGESEQIQKVLAHEVLQSSLELVSQRFKDHGIDLRVIAIDRQLCFECRPTQIMQILVNLLNNAHDAVEKLKSKWVSIEILDHADEIEFVIADSGQGIPAQTVEKLFEPFFTTKDIHYGTGLGLSISKSLAQKHKGTLVYDGSSENTRFVLTLPKRQP